eukprot:g6094.t1
MSVSRPVLNGFFFASLAGLLFGYIIGVNSDILTEGAFLCSSGETAASLTAFGYENCYQLSPLLSGLFSSMSLIGACIALVITFVFGNSLGRRKELIIAGFFYVIGSTIAALTPYAWFVFVGVFIYGIGIGFAMHAAPVYIAEISPENYRGLLVGLKEVFIVVGMVAGFLAGLVFKNYELNWRFCLLAANIFTVPLLVGMSILPPSPRWLIIKAQSLFSQGLVKEYTACVDDARKALTYFRPTCSEAAIEAELRCIQKAGRDCCTKAKNGPCFDVDGDIENATPLLQSNSEKVSKWTEVFSYSRPLFVGVGLVLLQQVTGQPSVLFYTVAIFRSAGFDNNAASLALGLGLMKLFATSLSVLKVDSYGRRFLLFLGTGCMATALALLSLAFSFQECSDPVHDMTECSEKDIKLPGLWGIITVLALGLYVIGYQIGFGPVSWLVISEIFPLRVRNSAVSIAVLSNFVSFIIVTATFETLIEWAGPSLMFFGYFVLCIVSIVFVGVFVPETKGKTLEEIEKLFGNENQGDKDEEHNYENRSYRSFSNDVVQ